MPPYPLVKEYEKHARAEESMRGEVDLVRAENMTLKKLVIAKDRVLIQKTRLLDNIKVQCMAELLSGLLSICRYTIIINSLFVILREVLYKHTLYKYLTSFFSQKKKTSKEKILN